MRAETQTIHQNHLIQRHLERLAYISRRPTLKNANHQIICLTCFFHHFVGKIWVEGGGPRRVIGNPGASWMPLGISRLQTPQNFMLRDTVKHAHWADLGTYFIFNVHFVSRRSMYGHDLYACAGMKYGPMYKCNQ
jgi:hypothetical protein